ncbi:MAG: MerR family transcriptional regulator [Coriobacteriales bacterium]|jgi:DNA-binding transcriptional MerR regulator|nr:MerR family transcriptional regulator [Coriobacteriales bacterium]
MDADEHVFPDQGSDEEISGYIPLRRFSQIVRIPVSTLRYYDNIGLFKAAYHAPSGYRYYAPMQIVTVKFIRVLVDCGVPLKEIGRLTKARAPESMTQLLYNQVLELDHEIARLSANRTVLNTFANLIVNGILADESQITVEKLPATPVVMGERNHYDADGQLFYRAFVQFLQQTPGISLSYPVGGLFDDIELFAARPSQPSRFFSIDPAGGDARPAGRYLMGYARGYYGQIGDLADRLLDFAEQQHLTLTGPLYHIYLQDEVSVQDPDQYLMQASVRVKS